MQRVPVLRRAADIGPNLVDELLAIPSLAPVIDQSGAKESVFRLVIEREEVVLEVPDTANRAAITQVLAQHVRRDPAPLGPTPKPRKDRAREALDAIDSTKLTAETRKLVAVLRELIDD